MSMILLTQPARLAGAGGTTIRHESSGTGHQPENARSGTSKLDESGSALRTDIEQPATNRWPPNTMFISVVIPVYNECSTIDQIVAAVQAVPLDKEIILVDDASTDGSREKIEKIEADSPRGSVKALLQKRNMGKGAALRAGFAAATGDIVLIQDADLEYDPQDYPTLIEPIVSGQADVVYGSRFVGSQAHRVLYFWHSIGNRLLTLLSNMFTDLNLTDMETCYKVFRREVIEQIHLREDRFGIEPELTAKVARLHCRVFEVGIAYRGRTYAEGKKIGWRDGMRAIWCIVKYNLLAGSGGHKIE